MTCKLDLLKQSNLLFLTLVVLAVATHWLCPDKSGDAVMLIIGALIRHIKGDDSPPGGTP